MDLFDLNRKPTYVRGGQTDGRVKVKEEAEFESCESECDQGRNEESVDPWSEVDDSMLNKFGPLHLPGLSFSEVFIPYYTEESLESQVDLPITSYRNKILDIVGRSQVTVITGSTGCGKTTQVPQFILDWYAMRGLHCNIIVIQPRRVSVITVAQRVCEERGWELGSLCGYKVSLTSKTSDDTRLLYVTTGIFLQILLNTKRVENYTHIIFDEIHEREQIMDFSLLAVKKLLATNSPTTKLILMSATAEVTRFSNFFKSPDGTPAPVLSVKLPALYSVDIFYLEDLELLENVPEPSYDRPQVSKDLMSLCMKLFTQFDVLDYKSNTKAAVLVFLPGTADIEDLYKMIKKQATGPCREFCKWYPVPIHSSLSADDQNKAFSPAPPGHRKIVIATNIAESSVTIPDAAIVVDFCLTKIVTANSEANLTKLNMVWASKANLTQRAGRVGRVANGIVYRLIPHSFMQEDIRTYNSPDMTRCLLQKTTLQTIMLGMGDPQIFLADALDPPNPDDIKRSVLVLREMGAFSARPSDPNFFSPNSLTMLGNLMAVLPVDIEHTRMIILGYVFSVFKEALIIVACLSTKGIFANSFREKMRFYQKKLTWANGSCSDCIALLNVYETWKRHQESGYFERKPGNNELEWANKHCLQLNCLREAEKLVNDLIDRFKEYGIEEPREPERVVWLEEQREHVLKLVIAGTYYPNYFALSFHSPCKLEIEAVEDLSGRDPFRTACFTNFPRGENYELYLDLVHEYLSECDQKYTITTNYDKKLFIEFPKDGEPCYKYDPEIPFDGTVPGGISMGVYKAFKIRFISKNLEFMTLTAEDAQAKKLEIKAKQKEEEKNEQGCISPTKSFPSGIPAKDTIKLPVEISHVITPGQFWCSSKDKTATAHRSKLNDCLNDFRTKLESFRYPPKFGQMCVVKNDNEGGALYRAKILNVDIEVTEQESRQDLNLNQRQKSGKKNRRGKKRCNQENKQDEVSWSARVLLIDIGKQEVFKRNSVLKYSSKLYAATKRIPALAFECTLTETRPSPFKNANSRWVPEATDVFKDITNGAALTAKIFSIVSGVVSMTLCKTLLEGNEEVTLDINRYLVELGYATECEEKWLSEKYFRIRSGEHWLEDKDIWINRRYMYGDFDTDLMSIERPVKLGGPYSPLELNLVPATSGKRGLNVGMNGSSVNCILLNPYSRDPYSKLFVAAAVSQAVNRDGLTVNNTTLMPNIPGWAGIIPVLFAPVAEIRISRDKKRYTGALCGLGLDEEGIPVYPENDMEVMFDVEVTRDDLIDINRIRLLASAMFNKQFYDERFCSHVDRFHFATTVKECVENLFFTKRNFTPLEPPECHFLWTPNLGLHKWDEPFFDDLAKVSMFRPHIAYDVESTSYNTTGSREMGRFHEFLNSRQGSCKSMDCEFCAVTGQIEYESESEDDY